MLERFKAGLPPELHRRKSPGGNIPLSCRAGRRGLVHPLRDSPARRGLYYLSACSRSIARITLAECVRVTERWSRPSADSHCMTRLRHHIYQWEPQSACDIREWLNDTFLKEPGGSSCHGLVSASFYSESRRVALTNAAISVRCGIAAATRE